MEKIRKGDEVIVLTGKDKGKRGQVLSRVGDDKVLVEGINRAKKHVKPNPVKGVVGGIVDKDMPLHISNVAVFLIIITFLLLFGPGQYFLYLIVGLYGEPCFIPMIYSIACLIVMTIFLFLMPKRSKQGNKVYGSAKGFKKFIDVTKKDK